MGIYFGLLRVDKGFVIFADTSTDPKRPELSTVFKINEHNAVILKDDIIAGKLFFQKYLEGVDAANYGFEEIIDQTTKSLNKKDPEFVGKLLTFTFVGYSKNAKQRTFFDLWFNGDSIVRNYQFHSTEKMLFYPEANLGSFLTEKAYSNSMPLQVALDLMGYVILQYSVLFRHAGIGEDFVVMTISEEGFKILNKVEIQKLLENAEQMDVAIRKECVDFFVSNNFGSRK